jgi:recombinational DNA repair protein (RecF pathway)
MTSGLEINQLIMETIHENSPSETVVQLILESLQYELDIWNRYVSWNEISGQYELMVDRIVREMLD